MYVSFPEDRCRVSKVSIERDEGIAEAIHWLLTVAPPAVD